MGGPFREVLYGTVFSAFFCFSFVILSYISAYLEVYVYLGSVYRLHRLVRRFEGDITPIFSRFPAIMYKEVTMSQYLWVSTL